VAAPLKKPSDEEIARKELGLDGEEKGDDDVS
jgi:hypothetical protein